MKKTNEFSPEVKERAVRMVYEHRGEYPSQWAAIESIAPKIGCAPQTLHEWVRKHEIDTGMRDGVSSEEHERINGKLLPAIRQGKHYGGVTLTKKPPQNPGRFNPNAPVTGMPSIPE